MMKMITVISYYDDDEISNNAIYRDEDDNDNKIC